MQRRDFLTAGFGFLGMQVHAGEKPRPAIVDCHTHFYDPSRPQGVPWPGKGSKELYRTVLPEEYERFARPHRVVGTVVVEASPWVEDNQWLLDLAAKNPFLCGIVGRLDTQSDDFEKHLARFARNPLYRGIRISQNELATGLNGKLISRGRQLVDHGLELDVNGGPAMLPDVTRLAVALPKLKIVINHCANVQIDGQVPPQPWREGIAQAAKHANVFCKVSALVEHTGLKAAPSDVKYYQPVLNVLWSCFGEDRLIFGSNWPVSDRGAPFATLLAIVQEFMSTKGGAAVEKFFLRNSQVAYGWSPRT